MSNRRQFLKNAAALSLCSAASTASLLASFRSLAADTSGYRALVCLFLYGGMDNHDTILPYDRPSYDRYAAIRQSLLSAHGGSRAHDNLLQLVPGNAASFGSRQFALPVELSALHGLFKSGAAAIVANVGPLLAPTTRRDYESNPSLAPTRLFSHNDQRSTWMSLRPEGARFGWGGRFADAQIASGANRNAAFSAISLFGNAVFACGQLARPYHVSPGGVPPIHVLQSQRLDFEKHLSEPAYEMLLAHFRANGIADRNLLVNDVAAEHRRSSENNQLFNSVLGSAPALLTAFPNTDLGRELLGVAKTIAVRERLGASRQVFFVGRRGFDTHSSQANTLPALHSELAEAIAAFYEAMQELGTAVDVTLFTASEFGRTLAVNGDGTDHGWGSHHFVVGGSVIGGRVYGDIPPYDFGHDHDVGSGRLIPTVSLQQYAATLGRWFGLTRDELGAVLPGLYNFPQVDLMFV